jgi:S-adenosylmethionine decarboxylase
MTHKKEEKEFRGKHVIADIQLSDNVPDNVSELCMNALDKSNMTVVCETRKNFRPGETIVFILAESHFTVHTYPEHKYLSVDCYTCGTEGKPERAIKYLIAQLPVARARIDTLERGRL